MFPTEHYFHQTNVNLNLFLENFTEKKKTTMAKKFYKTDHRKNDSSINKTSFSRRFYD